MINILIKVDCCHTIAILDDNSIHLYNESVEDFMDKYLLNILRTYETSIIRGKFISVYLNTKHLLHIIQLTD